MAPWSTASPTKGINRPTTLHKWACEFSANRRQRRRPSRRQSFLWPVASSGSWRVASRRWLNARLACPSEADRDRRDECREHLAGWAQHRDEVRLHMAAPDRDARDGAPLHIVAAGADVLVERDRHGAHRRDAAGVTDTRNRQLAADGKRQDDAAIAVAERVAFDEDMTRHVVAEAGAPVVGCVIDRAVDVVAHAPDRDAQPPVLVSSRRNRREQGRAPRCEEQRSEPRSIIHQRSTSPHCSAGREPWRGRTAIHIELL